MVLLWKTECRRIIYNVSFHKASRKPEFYSYGNVHATKKTNYGLTCLIKGAKLPTVSKLKFLESGSNYVYQANTADSSHSSTPKDQSKREKEIGPHR